MPEDFKLPLERTEEEEELMRRFGEADSGQLEKEGLSYDVSYDREHDLHIAVFPTPKDMIPLNNYLAFVPIRIGGHAIPDDRDMAAAALTGINTSGYHIIGIGRKFSIDGNVVDQAPYYAKDLNAVPKLAIDIWRQNR